MKSFPSIAYGFKTCSQKYKVSPQEKFVNNWKPALDCWEAGVKILKAIGYDAGEERRAKIAGDEKYENWYPLIEWGMYREECEVILKSENLPISKSSCFFCPSMKKHEILRLAKEHPELAARAVAMEKNADLVTIKGLGRNYAWGDLLANDANQIKMFEDPTTPDIPCGCYDGEDSK